MTLVKNQGKEIPSNIFHKHILILALDAKVNSTYHNQIY